MKSNVYTLKYDDLDKFNPKEVQLIQKNAAIFANNDAPDCPECGREKSPTSGSGDGLCLYCIEERLKKQKPVSLAHLPERWPADAHAYMMAKGLMSAHHKDALRADVAILFKLKHGEKNGKVVLGSCAKQSPKNKMLHGWDYIIELAWDMWALMDDRQREATMLHEICHIYKDEHQWKIESHNVEEFVKVIEAYGLWKPDLQQFAEAIRRAEEGDGQMGLPLPAGAIGRLTDAMEEGDSIQVTGPGLSTPKLVKRGGKMVEEGAAS